MNDISAKLLNAELQLTQMKNTAEQWRGRAEESTLLTQKLVDLRQAHNPINQSISPPVSLIRTFLRCGTPVPRVADPDLFGRIRIR